jgi:hypothetical protein
MPRKAEVYTYETDMGDHYSVNLKDETGKTVSTQVMRDINEAKRVKENWENGRYQYLAES